jgi:AraC family transcriptional regulator
MRGPTISAEQASATMGRCELSIHFQSTQNVKRHRLSIMSVTQIIHGYGRSHPCNQLSYNSASEPPPLAMVTGFLDAALRIWDADRIQARSQVKVAAAMLRDYAGGSVADGPARASDTGGLVPWQTRKVKEFIDTSLESTIRVQDCASTVRLSAGYFSQVFKATFGTTVHTYIRHRRIERAQQLMLLSKEPLSQIALACGFSDQAHYCRVFRDVVGLSPNAWRRRNKNLAPDE